MGPLVVVGLRGRSGGAFCRRLLPSRNGRIVFVSNRAPSLGQADRDGDLSRSVPTVRT